MSRFPKHLLLLSGIALAGLLFARQRSRPMVSDPSCSPRRGGGVLSAAEVRALYDRLAPLYGLLATGYSFVGSGRFRHRVVEALELRSGETVVDLGCGTGANLPYLVEAVGPTGRIIGVDLSPGMLTQAHERLNENGWQNVELVEADIRAFAFPEPLHGIVSTFALEMVPEHTDVIERAVSALEPGRRIAVAGLRRPERWPEWLIRLGSWVNRPFGVTRAYEDIQPWHSIRAHTQEICYEEALFGAVYLSVGRTISSSQS